jgi:4-diphosphocytidyl-2-C-methyl-D-erythritol kinase
MSQPFVIKSHAKVNLGLCLLGKREDGYHELETLMHEVDLADEIILNRAQTTHIKVNGKEWDESQGQNLIIKAKQLCERELGCSCGEWDIQVNKKIPMGSGMGGGSSNAIAFLNYVQSLWPEQLTGKVMDEMAASLGSDTNFFIHGGSAVCRGRGEQVSILQDRQLFFNLIFPDFSCSTPKVFSKVKLDFTSSLNWQEIWRGKFLESTRNDLEKACCEAYPKIKELLERLREKIPQVCLSGSGSTMFTISETKADSLMLHGQIKQLCDEKIGVFQAQSYSRA